MSAANPQKKCPTAVYVDNKRKLLEKNLSACQRDQVYLNIARDELQLKQNIVSGFTEASRESNKAFEQISKSIESVGQSIGNGLALLAQALGGMQNNTQPAATSGIQSQQYYPQDYHYQQPFATPAGNPH